MLYNWYDHPLFAAWLERAATARPAPHAEPLGPGSAGRATSRRSWVRSP